MKREIETATVRKMHWVQVATAASTPADFAAAAPIVEPPPPPEPEGWPAAYEQPRVNVQAIAIYHGLLTLEQVAEMRAWLAQHGFDGEVVTWPVTP